MDKNRIFKEKGITLIALIVTIIVLLILAGVSIAVLTGENGILNRATEAKKTNENSEVIENIRLAYNNAQIGKYSGANEVFKDVIKSDLEKTYGTGNVTVDYSEQEQKYSIEIIGKGLYEIQADGTVQKQGANIEIGTVTYVLKDLNNQIVSTPKIQGEGTVEIHFIPTLAGGSITGVTVVAPMGLTASTPTLTGNEWVTTVSTNGTYTFTITGSTSDGTKTREYPLEVKKFSTLPSGLKIGSTVTYNPNITTSTAGHTFNWEAELCSSTKTPIADDRLLDITGSGDNNMAITSWRVFSIDEENEKVELISTAPSPNTVYLGEAQGYNNAVYLLNNTCNNLYGGTLIREEEEYIIEGRNVNIEDIEDKMTETALNAETTGAHKYNNGTATYGNQKSSEYPTEKSNYPLIYTQEYNSVINGNKNTSSNALNPSSKQTSPIHRVSNALEPQRNGTSPIKKESTTLTPGYIQATENIQPYQTDWNKDNNFMQNAFKAIEEERLKGIPDGTSKNTNYTLFIPNDSSTPEYWLASRMVSLGPNSCGFGVRRVGSGIVGSFGLFYSSSSSYNNSSSLRPIVKLDAVLISPDGANFKVE